MTFSALAVNAKADAQAALLAGGTLEILDGTKVLALLRFSNPAFGPAVDGRVTAHALKPDASHRASGSADGFRALTARGELVYAGTAGKASGDLRLNNVVVHAGDTVVITALTLTEPMT